MEPPYIYIYMSEISCNNHHNLGIDISQFQTNSKNRRSGAKFASSRGGISPTELTWDGKQLGRTPVNPKRKFPLSPTWRIIPLSNWHIYYLKHSDIWDHFQRNLNNQYVDVCGILRIIPLNRLNVRYPRKIDYFLAGQYI